MPVLFIPDEIVLLIHRDTLQTYGGRPGIRDKNLLESALAQPKMTMGRRFVHRTLFEKAGAYGYHVCSNHPFIDGNKRVSFLLMAIFLDRNGWELKATEEDAYSLMIDLASGTISKSALATWLKEHSSKRRS
jgi:death-on-curing protein